MLLTYLIEIESSEIVGSGRRADISTSPWKYHISKLHSKMNAKIYIKRERERPSDYEAWVLRKTCRIYTGYVLGIDTLHCTFVCVPSTYQFFILVALQRYLI